MRIEVKQKVITTKEIEVQFPIYRRQRTDTFNVFTKVESIDREITIYLYKDERKVEIEVSKPDFIWDEDYVLGKGQYSCNESQFNSAVLFAKDIVSDLG